MLKGKIVFITGANGGIGRALVEAFAKAGADIWANVRNSNQDFSKYCEKLAIKYKVHIVPIAFDTTEFEMVKNAVAEIKKASGHIDVLVNNAGILKESLFQMTTMNDIKDMFDVNFFAPVYLMQLVSRLMTRQNSGAIINISSIAAFDGVEGQTIYGATKAALATVTKSLAKELGKYHIRANCIAPGVTKTPLIQNMKEEVLQKDQEKTYLNRLGNPEEVANVAVFLASNASCYITGQVIRVDGGRN